MYNTFLTRKIINLPCFHLESKGKKTSAFLFFFHFEIEMKVILTLDIPVTCMSILTYFVIFYMIDVNTQVSLVSFRFDVKTKSFDSKSILISRCHP